jgi:EAL domain-containing protein (putative c-di-GMP-specific phosphodiesterase class I)/CHASE2 domain-containing sensor protein
LVAALIIGFLTVAYDAGRDVDHAMQQVRDRLHPRAATGQVAVIEIDSRSLAQINHWPWPRSVHGRIVDKLRAAKVRSIAFDVDFSSPSLPWEDKSFGAALERAGGGVILATFRQLQTSGGTQVYENLPIAPLRDHAFLASVNIVPDEDGLVRHYEAGVVTARVVHPSIPALLAETSSLGQRSYAIDQSINPATIPRYSFVDVLSGRVPAAQLAGKRVLIGATAVEMGDRYAVPNFGVLPGAVIQAIATETLLQGTLNANYGPLPLMLIALLSLVLAQRVKWNLVRGLHLLGGCALILIIPYLLEVLKLGTFEVAPALAMLLAGGLMMLEAAVREAFLHSLSTDHDTGLPNLTGLRRDAGAIGSHSVAVARIQHYSEISLLLGAELTATALQRIADRLVLASAQKRVYRVEDNALAWLCDDANAEEIADRFAALAALFRSPLVIGTRHIDVSFSFGIAQGSTEDGGTLCTQALLAAHRAADQGILWDMHSAQHGAEVDWKMSLLSEVDQALANGDMWVAYQPKADIKTGALIGAEALVRWRHPERGPIAPDHFIPVIEKEGRIADLTLFVVKRAIEDLRGWMIAGARRTIAVNISVSLLNNRDFQQKLATLVRGSSIDPALLVFEITESAAFDNPDLAVEAMTGMRALGVSLSIDDYGTGQSTLTYLKRLPASEIKIDKSFVVDLPKSRNDQILVRSTIALAHELGFKVVAEGIENRETFELLKSYGCDTAQGWHIGRPMPIEELDALFNVPLAIAA